MWYSLAIASSLSSELNQCINTVDCVQCESQHANTQLDEEKQKKKACLPKELISLLEKYDFYIWKINLGDSRH